MARLLRNLSMEGLQMRFVYLLVCFGLLTACGSDGGSDAGAGMNMGADGGSPPSTDGGTDPNTDAGAQGTAFDDAFSEEWADVICEKFETCFAVLSELSVGPNCREDWKNRATPAQDIVNASIDAGRINYDSAAWADCVAEARATSCDGLTFADIFALVACPEAIQGTVADGGDCLFWADCSPSSFCLETEGACGGVCTPKLTAGEACESDEACIDDVCTGVCAVKVEVGEPCDANDMSEDGSAPRVCADGIECVVDEGSGMATCTNLTPSFTAEVGSPVHWAHRRLSACRALTVDSIST